MLEQDASKDLRLSTRSTKKGALSAHNFSVGVVDACVAEVVAGNRLQCLRPLSHCRGECDVLSGNPLVERLPGAAYLPVIWFSQRVRNMRGRAPRWLLGYNTRVTLYHICDMILLI